MIELKPREGGGYSVYFKNGTLLGYFDMAEDGYYHYWPSSANGYWAATLLRAIADKLAEVNRTWDDIVQNDAAIG